jgi:hypothetical protein
MSKNNYIMLIGDMNARAKNNKVINMADTNRKAALNNNGEKLIDFCIFNSFKKINIFFKA